MVKQAVALRGNKRKLPESNQVSKKTNRKVETKVVSKKEPGGSKLKNNKRKKEESEESSEESDIDESEDSGYGSELKSSSSSDADSSSSSGKDLSEDESSSETGSSEGEEESGDESEDGSEEEEEESGDESEDGSEEEEEESGDESEEESEEEVPKKGMKKETKKVNSKVGELEFTVFVGNLPYEITKEKLSKAFEKCGSIQNVRLVIDKKTSKSRGIGFIDFSSQSGQDKAIKLNGTSLFGRTIRVDAASSTKEFGNKPTSRPSPIIFVGNLHFSTTEKKLEEVFRKHGNVVSVRIPSGQDKKSKGYGYIQYDKVESAMAAMSDPRLEIDGRIVRLDYDNGNGSK